MEDLIAPEERAAVLDSANTFVAVFTRIGAEEAAAITCGWSRRRLIAVALVLASRNVKINHGGAADPHRLRPKERILREEERWSDEAAKLAHRTYEKGVRSARILEGNRVYARRIRKARKEAAIEAVRQRFLDEHEQASA